jgi:peptide deformylase
MAIRRILELGDPLLRTPCVEVPEPPRGVVGELVGDLLDTLRDARSRTGYGRGIAAPQIGVLARVVVLDLPRRPYWVFVNPTIVARSAETRIVWDGCLSFLEVFCQVERHTEIAVRYQDLHGTWHRLDAGDEDDLAELLQHEIDHLDGILTIDRLVDPKSLVTRGEFERRFRAESPYGR